ncbi:MAG TPA: enolase C-terminal domain-like protein [Solirubrobacterales bacterium]|nr:enolase C-terminal domain-like protein [Solirubrobacterales bacterium]
MRIAELDVIPVGLPFADPYVTATGRLDQREMLIVRIAAADGTAGWGDAVPMGLRGGPGTSAVRRELEGACRPELVGRDVGADPGRFIRPALERCLEAGAGAQAVSAIDIALLDLCGRLAGEPAWRILGAAAAAPIVCNATLGADAAERAGEAAAAAVRAGFRTLKVKVGDGSDVERMRAVRAAAGPDARLRIDANGSWDVAEASGRLEELGPLTIELVEQPCLTVGELAVVRAATDVPVVADESVKDLAEATSALADGACDAVTLKLAKVGGPHAAVAIAAAVPAFLSSALDSVLGIAAATHAAQAMSPRGFAIGRAHGLATSGLFTDNVADDVAFRGPELEVGRAPGLGIDPDPAAIERLRLR